MSKILIKLNPAQQFEAPVSLTIPGLADPVVARFQFRHLGRTALQAWMDKPAQAKQSGQELSDPQWLGDVVVGWHADDFEDAFTPEAFATLLDNYLTAGTEIYQGYLKGLTESRAKN